MSCWILLRGLIRESRHWGDFPAIFQRHFPDAEILTPDLPGNGTLNGMRSPLTIDAMVDHCRTWLASRQHSEPVYLLGLSMGGMLAVRWAQRYPQELGGCVLINSSLKNFSPFHQRLQWRSYMALFRMLGNLRDATACERLVWEMTSSRQPVDSRTLQQWVEFRRERPVSMGNTLRQLTAASRCRAADHAPAVRLLVLAAERDRLVSPICSKQIAQAWKADLRLHPDAGHDLALDDGKWIAGEVRNWMRQSLERTSSATEATPSFIK